jgi:hypothetical protein
MPRLYAKLLLQPADNRETQLITGEKGEKHGRFQAHKNNPCSRRALEAVSCYLRSRIAIRRSKAPGLYQPYRPGLCGV